MPDVRTKSVSTETWIIAAAAGLTLPVSTVAAKGMAPLFIAAVLAALIGLVRQGFRFPSSRTAHLLIASAAAFLVWSGLSALWSINPGRSLEMTVSNTAAVAGATVLYLFIARAGAPAIHRVGQAAIIGTAIAAAIILFELSTTASLNRLAHGNLLPVEKIPIPRNYLNGSAAVFVMMLWPLTALLGNAGRTGIAIGTGVLLFVLSFAGAASTAMIAATLGAAAGVIAAWRPGFFRIVAGAGFAAAILLMPIATDILPDPKDRVHSDSFDFSVNHRMRIWHFATDRIMERPVLGWGLDSSRAIPGGKDIEMITLVYPDGGEFPWAEQQLPLHPHNIFLQIWLELGLVGALFGAGALLALVWAISLTESAWVRFSSAGAMAAGVTFSGLSYSIWQSWWFCTLMFALALLGACRGAPGQRS